RIFGTDRGMFASNFPVDSLVGTFTEIYDGFRAAVADLPLPEQKKLFHDNASRIYRIQHKKRLYRVYFAACRAMLENSNAFRTCLDDRARRLRDFIGRSADGSRRASEFPQAARAKRALPARSRQR